MTSCTLPVRTDSYSVSARGGAYQADLGARVEVEGAQGAEQAEADDHQRDLQEQALDEVLGHVERRRRQHQHEVQQVPGVAEVAEEPLRVVVRAQQQLDREQRHDEDLAELQVADPLVVQAVQVLLAEQQG